MSWCGVCSSFGSFHIICSHLCTINRFGEGLVNAWYFCGAGMGIWGLIIFADKQWQTFYAKSNLFVQVKVISSCIQISKVWQKKRNLKRKTLHERICRCGLRLKNMNCRNALVSIPTKPETGHIVTETIALEGSILRFHDHGRKKSMCA